jgi:carbon monoxide dehydrogenase subunit G
MKLEQSFEVAAPLEEVWKALIDVERVAPCLPGASVTGRNEDGSYAGSLTIKIGPTTAAYAGKLEMEQIDESEHSAVMQAQGTDKRGQGGAKATISSKLRPGDNVTHVDVITDYHITGRLARFGRGGMIEDISERLLRQFADSLQASLTGDSAAEAATADGAESGAAADGNGGPGPAEQAAPTGEPLQAKEAQPLDAIPLVAGVVRARAKENPAPLIALVVGFILALVIFRRRGRG